MEELTRTMMGLIASEICGRPLDLPPLPEETAAQYVQALMGGYLGKASRC